MNDDITVFDANDIENHIDALGSLLHACVHDGASIGFVLPFSQADGEAFWVMNVLPSVRQGKRLLLVSRKDGKIVGTGQLDYDTPPNQPHRAEIRKVMVHPDFRRQGVAKALMIELEDLARRLGRGLITLDTRTGDKAEPLYTALGYHTAGIIPGYCRDPFKDHLDPTTIMYKTI
jgi:ribosomal protein S18 acetylase RimI-like enzyme